MFPALALNYLGQGAELISDPKWIENPFYLLFPEWALYPMVALATAATVIASQATITGAYSLTKQAIQLGFLPRMVIQQTSAKEIGQIYLPAVNWILLVMVMGAVLGFGSSTNLASAYGVAVTGTMVVATFLTFFVIRFGWGYNLALCLLSTGFFMVVDVAFFSSSILKVPQGGWFPLVLGFTMFLFMTTWRRGRQILMERLQSSAIPLNAFLQSLFDHPLQRVGGTAVFMVSNVDAVPHAMLPRPLAQQGAARAGSVPAREDSGSTLGAVHRARGGEADGQRLLERAGEIRIQERHRRAPRPLNCAVRRVCTSR